MWRAPVNARTSGAGCPCCAGYQVSVTNRLSSVAKAVARQWHPTRNRPLTPRDVVSGSDRRVWWKCPKGRDHVWRAAIHARVVGSGCPACSHRQVSRATSLAGRSPQLAAQWDHARNGQCTPLDVMPSSKRMVWWKCPRGRDHRWRATVVSRWLGPVECPFCRARRPSVTNSLAVRSRAVAAEWHPTRNGALEPGAVSVISSRYAWWRCREDPRHEWRATISNRTRLGTNCPYCAGKKVDATNCLTALAPEVAAQWHPRRNGALTPRDVSCGSGKRVWWRCPAGPDHEWSAPVQARTSGVGCPFCAGKALSVTNSVRARAPAVAAEWHPTHNGALCPEGIVAGSSKRVWWRCRIDPAHEWQAPVINRTRGSGCPRCAARRRVAAALAVRGIERRAD